MSFDAAFYSKQTINGVAFFCSTIVITYNFLYIVSHLKCKNTCTQTIYENNKNVRHLHFNIYRIVNRVIIAFVCGFLHSQTHSIHTGTHTNNGQWIKIYCLWWYSFSSIDWIFVRSLRYKPFSSFPFSLSFISHFNDFKVTTLLLSSYFIWKSTTNRSGKKTRSTTVIW